MVVDRKYTIGDTRLNNKCESFTIIEWNHAHDVLIVFQNGEIVRTRSSAINSGSVLNRYSPTVCGVGITEGWITSERDSRCREYNIWSSMLKRVCDPRHKNYESYKHCSISEEWFWLKHFGEWVTSLPQWKHIGWHLDKDISGGNAYSPDTCYLVPKSINSMITTRGGRAKSSDLPRGVCQIGKMYQGRYGSGSDERTKMFCEMEEAYEFHIHGSKHLLIKEVNKYRADLDAICVEKLMCFDMKGL